MPDELSEMVSYLYDSAKKWHILLEKDVDIEYLFVSAEENMLAQNACKKFIERGDLGEDKSETQYETDEDDEMEIEGKEEEEDDDDDGETGEMEQDEVEEQPAAKEDEDNLTYQMSQTEI